MLGMAELAPSVDSNNAGQPEAFSYTAKDDGPVDIINVYLERELGPLADRRASTTTTTGVRGSCSPRTASPTSSCRAGTACRSTPVELEKGKRYWIAVMGGGGGVVLRTHSGGKGTSDSVTGRRNLSALQQNWTTDRVWRNDGPASIYAAEAYNVLVFTKNSTGGTAEGVAGLRALADADEVTFDVTDDASKFTESNLAKYRVVVFLNNAGELLDSAQQGAFEDYFRGGGGFLGIHSAIEAEPDWQFMSDLLGTRASGRTDPLSATTKVADRGHIASKGLPEYWTRTDRWYNFTSNVRGFSHVLATVDENTYNPGERVRLRPSDRLVQGLPGRPLVLHRRRRHRRRVRGRQRPPSARGRARLGGRHGERDLQRLRRHRVGELPADEDRGSAEHQRADRLRPAARRPRSCRPSATGASASTTR